MENVCLAGFKITKFLHVCFYSNSSRPKESPLKKRQGEANVASKKEKSSMSCALST